MYSYMDNVASLQTSLSSWLKSLLCCSHFYLILSTSGADNGVAGGSDGGYDQKQKKSMEKLNKKKVK